MCLVWKAHGAYYLSRVKKKDVFWKASTPLGAAQGIAMFLREASKALDVKPPFAP